jgi:NADH dehydrogenase (ubiquinone) 1 alpha subcomplex subunit 8
MLQLILVIKTHNCHDTFLFLCKNHPHYDPLNPQMTTHREGTFVEKLWVEKDPLPSDIPSVPEVGCTSAPLESMAFHFGAACKEYNEDYILCKQASNDPEKCLKEGRRVTRCGLDL